MTSYVFPKVSYGLTRIVNQLGVRLSYQGSMQGFYKDFLYDSFIYFQKQINYILKYLAKTSSIRNL
jgi:hypothetical protein